MKIIKKECPYCGEIISIGEEFTEITCEYCGKSFSLNKNSASTKDKNQDSRIKQEYDSDKSKSFKVDDIKNNDNNNSTGLTRSAFSLSAEKKIIACCLLGFVFILGFLAIKASNDDRKEKERIAALTDKGIENGVYAPGTVSDYMKQNYTAVEMGFEAAGFTNIETVPMGDLVAGLLNSDGEIASITINGSSFEKGEQFSPDALVIISYHSYPDNRETTDTNTEETADDDYTYEVVSLDDVVYVYPIGWTVQEDGNTVNYINPDGDFEMLVSIVNTNASVEDDDFNERFSSSGMADLLEGDADFSICTIGGHRAVLAEGKRSGNDDLILKIYFADYKTGLLAIGFEYDTVSQDESMLMERNLLSAFIFAGREEILYTEQSLDGIFYEVPEKWVIDSMASDKIVYSDDVIFMQVTVENSTLSVEDEDFEDIVLSQSIWDDVRSERTMVGNRNGWLFQGVNNMDGGYYCLLYIADCNGGQLQVNFFYYPEYEILYSAPIEHIVDSFQIP